MHELDFAADARTLTFVRALVTAAAGDEEVLGWIGAGPLEHLVRDDRMPASVIVDVCTAAATDADFRSALASVWLGAEVAPEARRKLASLGAQDRSTRHR